MQEGTNASWNLWFGGDDDREHSHHQSKSQAAPTQMATFQNPHSGVGPGWRVDRDEAMNQDQMTWALGGHAKNFIQRDRGATAASDHEYV